jgi:PKD repeat protein
MWNECITVGNTAHFEVRNNLVFDSAKEGICLKDGSYDGKCHDNEVHHTGAVGFYVDAQAVYTHDIEVFNNVSHDGAEDGLVVASEVGGLLENVKLYNNVAYRNGWCGLGVSNCCIETHPLSNIQFVNNTSYDNGTVGWGGSIFHQNPQAEGVVIRNNVCSQSLTFQIVVTGDVPAGSYTVDHNLIDGFRGDAEEIRGTDYVEGDPRFQDAAGDDFHILADSPAVGMGDPDGAPAADFDGYPRGTPPDIGAFEHRDGSTCALSCAADVPTSVGVGAQADFSATATPSGACTGSVSYDWDFGDGSAHATTAQAQHAYLAAGTFSWRLRTTVDTASCTRTGTIAVLPDVTPPAISGVSKAGSPFRIKIAGSNFQDGVQVLVGGDAAPWGSTVRKSDASIVLKGGSSLKARFPQGQAVSIRVRNPDGGEATTTYTRP